MSQNPTIGVNVHGAGANLALSTASGSITSHMTPNVPVPMQLPVSLPMVANNPEPPVATTQDATKMQGTTISHPATAQQQMMMCMAMHTQQPQQPSTTYPYMYVHHGTNAPFNTTCTNPNMQVSSFGTGAISTNQVPVCTTGPANTVAMASSGNAQAASAPGAFGGPSLACVTEDSSSPTPTQNQTVSAAPMTMLVANETLANPVTTTTGPNPTSVVGNVTAANGAPAGIMTHANYAGPQPPAHQQAGASMPPVPAATGNDNGGAYAATMAGMGMNTNTWEFVGARPPQPPLGAGAVMPPAGQPQPAQQPQQQVYFVNARQYNRILKRRQARARIEEIRMRRKEAALRASSPNGSASPTTSVDGKVSPTATAAANGGVPHAGRKPYLHESRHKHAMKRPRGPGGRFLKKDELEEYYRKHPEEDPKNKRAKRDDVPNSEQEASL